VRSFRAVTPRAKLLRVDLGGQPFPFRAGQAASIGRHGQPLRKPYSIASSPSDLARSGALEFLVGLEPDGEPGPHLAGVGRGASIELGGPFGGFRLPPVEGRPVLFVAGGTGIAPLRSMLHDLLDRVAPPPIALVYSARTDGEMAFVPEFRRLAAAGTLDLTLTLTGHPPAGWSGSHGRVSRAMLARHVSPGRTVCAVCGPPAFVDHVVRALDELGVERDRIVTERY
jgi:phenol hydroxylase P5 protein